MGVRFVRDEKMALWGSASVISMGDSPTVPFFQDVLEFGTRRQLELFTIIGKIAIIQDVLKFGTHVQLHVPVQYSCTCLLLYNTRRILQLYTACTVHPTGTGVLPVPVGTAVLGGLPRAHTCTVLYGRYSSYSLYQVLSAWGGLRYLYWNSHTRC